MVGSDGIIRINYMPREQFIPFHQRQQRFACIVAHRRAGKTVACVHDLQRGALRCQLERPRFAYLAPFRAQAKQVAWDYLAAAAAPLLDHGAVARESELRIDYHNGGQVRLHGSDNIDALRGIYLDGVVLDEYADMDPRLWPEVIRPALADRGGWAVFIGTPKGRNAFHKTWRDSQADASWFSLMLKASETQLIPNSELELARRDLSEEQYAQEFECSFDAAIVGAYYGKLMTAAEADKRIAGVPYDPAARVWTAWDLGVTDATAIWFAQIVGREIHVIDYYEASGVDITHYVKEVEKRPYTYGGHIFPHDAWAKEKQTALSTVEFIQRKLDFGPVERAPDHRIEDGINAVRVMLPKCWFDATKCARGVDALKLYRSDYSDKLQALRASPVHDWTSHAADAFRYLALTLDKTITRKSFSRQIEYPSLGLL